MSVPRIGAPRVPRIGSGVPLVRFQRGLLGSVPAKGTVSLGSAAEEVDEATGTLKALEDVAEARVASLTALAAAETDATGAGAAETNADKRIAQRQEETDIMIRTEGFSEDIRRSDLLLRMRGGSRVSCTVPVYGA
jgi:hypothetical protein